MDELLNELSNDSITHTFSPDDSTTHTFSPDDKIVSDPDGSYTGVNQDNPMETPVQDADDL